MEQVYELTFNPIAAVSLAIAIASVFSLIIAFFFLGSDLLHAATDTASRIRRLASSVLNRRTHLGRGRNAAEHT